MKKILCLLIFLAFLQKSEAQTYDTTSYYGKVNYVFAHINKAAIPTGLLKDYGIDFSSVEDFSGTELSDYNWCTLTDFRTLYASIYSQQITNAPALSSLSTINTKIGSYSASSQPITFACLYYNYNFLDSNAISKHLFTVNKGQVYDVVGRTQSPYLQSGVFAIAPTVQSINTGVAHFIFRRELFYSNSGKTVSTIQIDPFGRGNYQTCTFNTTFSVNYDSAAIYPIVIKVTYTDGTINYSHTKIAAYATTNSNVMNYKKTNLKSSGSLCSIKKAPIWGVVNGYYYCTSYAQPAQTFTADKAFMGVKAEGDYTVCYATSNTSGKLKKPYIVLDGFDPYAVDSYTGMTFASYLTNINTDINQNPPPSIPLNGTYFNPNMDNNYGMGLDDVDGYDIVYLHWHNGTDYIERNAYLLETLINKVNKMKSTTNKNVIVGESMGGLVVRYALRDMEKNNIDHQIRLFISHDAPNWGANVPVAYQALVQYIAPWKIINPSSIGTGTISWNDMFPDAVNGVNLFQSPAAKEMLIQRYNLGSSNGSIFGATSYSLTSDNSTHTTFMNTLNGMGWPKNCRNVILSNGNCDGAKSFSDNAELASISGSQSWSYFGGLWRSLLSTIGGAINITGIPTMGTVPINNVSLISQFPLSLISTNTHLTFDWGAWAVPASGTSLLFKGDVYTHRKILWGLINTNTYILKCHVNSKSEMLPLDNVQGSQEDLSAAGIGININTIQNTLDSHGLGWVKASLLQPQFTFIPTVSSLAISNPNQNLTASFCDNIACLLPSGVSDYYTPPLHQLHISYTNDNSNWLLAEQAASYTCSQICPSTLSIEGESMVCGTSTSYSINNLPIGATVAWTTLPTGIATVNTPNASQTTISKIADGTITLTATISGNTVCNGPFTISKTIYCGIPTINCYRSTTYPKITIPLFDLPGLPPRPISASPTVNDFCASEQVRLGYYIPNAGFGVFTQIDGATTCKWHLVSASVPQHLIYKQVGNNLELAMQGVGESAVFSVSSTNSCGTSTAQYKFQTEHCPAIPINTIVVHAFAVSPNPASSNINISLASKNTTVSTAERSSMEALSSATPQIDNNLVITEVKVYDNAQTLKRVMKVSNSKNASMNIAGLTPGVYYVKITGNNDYSETQTIIIH